MDVAKTKRTTNRDQFEAMIEQMKRHPDIAKNLTKKAPEVTQNFWLRLKEELNALGPPSKDVSEWKKVWTDHKSTLKKKMVHNKREQMATGGGENRQHYFSPLENEVIDLLCLKDSVDGVPNARSFGVKRPHTTSNNVNAASTSNDAPNSNAVPTPQATSEPDHNTEESEQFSSGIAVPNCSMPDEGPQRKVPRQIKLLKTQIELQKTFHKEVTEVLAELRDQSAEGNANLKKIYRALDRIGDQEKKRNEILQMDANETKRHNRRIKELALDKNATKKKLLEIEIKKLELMHND